MYAIRSYYELSQDKKRRKLGTIISQVKTKVNEGLSLAEARNNFV